MIEGLSTTRAVMSVVRLPRPIVNQILSHAQGSPEAEICGLLAARDGHIVASYPIPNVASDPDILFEMDPQAQIQAIRHMRDNDHELYAIYHSHPHSPARPSATDLANATYPEAVYLIVSLNTKGVLEMRGFRLQDGKVEELGLELGQ